MKSYNPRVAGTLETLDEWFMPHQWPIVHWEVVLCDCYLPRRSPTKRPWLGRLLSHQKSPTKSPLTLKMLCPTFGEFSKLQTWHLLVNSCSPICCYRNNNPTVFYWVWRFSFFFFSSLVYKSYFINTVYIVLLISSLSLSTWAYCNNTPNVLLLSKKWFIQQCYSHPPFKWGWY